MNYIENDKRLREIIPERLMAEQAASGFGFTEGPVWCGDYLLFSDIPRNRIIRLNLLSDGPEVTTFRRPSGNSNGLTLDRSGRLIICESTSRRLTRTELDGSITVLAERYNEKRLNSPNDVVVRLDGTVYFTDPFYLSGNPPPPEELGFKGFFSVTPDGELHLLADDYIFPNGLAFSPDESVLYVNDTRNSHIRAYDVKEDGSIGNERIFIEMKGDEPGAPDGMKVDQEGNVYCTGPGGIWIMSPEGNHLGTIVLPEIPANICWGDKDWNTLYVTARTSIYRLRLLATGIAPYKVEPFPWS
ncbi:MAG: SMP-30/gluconolactonase/LRE family protein [Dehalococcoidales bacterium]|nr:MAG: SMP-30/gluconolactonase/LRE family protein [Dehalococcoidales bacterium]